MCLERQEKCLGSPNDAVTGSCKILGMGAGNQARAFFKSGMNR